MATTSGHAMKKCYAKSAGTIGFCRKLKQCKLLFLLFIAFFCSWSSYYCYINGFNFHSAKFMSLQRYGQFASIRNGENLLRTFERQWQMQGKNNGTSITECKLPQIDPWDPSIRQYLEPSSSYRINWLHNCRRTYPELTRLVNGFVVLHPEAKANGTFCQFRCLYPRTDYHFAESPWKLVSERPDCDVVETRCRHEKLQHNEFYYNYMHAQIYRRNGKLNFQSAEWSMHDDKSAADESDEAENKTIRAPDVHVLIFDSVSHSEFLRTMPNTVAHLRECMGAIEFPFLNKVGENSRPNGYALLLGIHTWPVEPSPFGAGYMPERDLDTMGVTALDEEESFVGFQFRDMGYRTMMAEDWDQGVFNFPWHQGFRRPPTDHYMRPFQLQMRGHWVAGNWTPNERYHDESCKEPHHYLMEYLRDFIVAYPQQPKFSITWMTEIAHGKANGLYRVDNEFQQFLVKNEKMLNNAFLFLMADHGARFGPISGSPQGALEDRNPAMFLVLPEYLRANAQLMGNLRENSRQLITHLDVHATLVSIAKQGLLMDANSTFGSLPSPEFAGTRKLLGQSLLYPLDRKVARNCATLRIPLDFCLCQFQSTNLSATEPELALLMAREAVSKMNADVAARGADDKCTLLTLDLTKPVEALEFEPELKFDFFKITFETVPGHGRFWGYMHILDRGLTSQSIWPISKRFTRLNEFAVQAHCTDKDPTTNQIAPYCFCLW